MAANRNGPCPPVTPVQSLATEEGWRQLKEDCRAELRLFLQKQEERTEKSQKKDRKFYPASLLADFVDGAFAMPSQYLGDPGSLWCGEGVGTVCSWHC